MAKIASNPARKALVIVAHPKGDYAPALVEGFYAGYSALDAAVDQLRALVINGKLTEKLQAVCERSILLGAMMQQLDKRAKKSGKTLDGEKLLNEALRINGLQGFKDDDASDKRRTKGEHDIWNAAKTEKSRAMAKLNLASVSKQGGKRNGAGAKRATPEEKAIAQTMVDAANGDLAPAKEAPAPVKETEILGERTLVKPAVGEDFKLKVPAKTPKDAAHYLYNLEKGLRMTMEANKAAFGQELVADVTKKILEQIQRLHNAEDKLNS